MLPTRRQELIRKKVESLLAECSITSPKVVPEKIASRYDIVIRAEPIDEEVSGFLMRQPGRPGAIIGINSNQPPKRKRFTLAHELGHFFLHGGQGYQEVHVDPKRFLVKWRDHASGQGVDLEEIEANWFAAELLMPTQFLEKDIIHHHGFDLSNDDTTAIAKLAARYDVSTQAMSYRLSNLERLV